MKRLAEQIDLPPRAWVVEEVREGEKFRAAKICSGLLDDHLWLIIDRSFTPADGLAIYYPEELAVLQSKSPDEIRQIHQAKLVFPGCRVIQERAESK